MKNTPRIARVGSGELVRQPSSPTPADQKTDDDNDDFDNDPQPEPCAYCGGSGKYDDAVVCPWCDGDGTEFW